MPKTVRKSGTPDLNMFATLNPHDKLASLRMRLTAKSVKHTLTAHMMNAMLVKGTKKKADITPIAADAYIIHEVWTKIAAMPNNDAANIRELMEAINWPYELKTSSAIACVLERQSQNEPAAAHI